MACLTTETRINARQARTRTIKGFVTPEKYSLQSARSYEGVNSLTHAEVNHTSGSYVYSMGILYGANFNMADRTAGQLETALRVSNACAKAFEPRTS